MQPVAIVLRLLHIELEKHVRVIYKSTAAILNNTPFQDDQGPCGGALFSLQWSHRSTAWRGTVG